MKKLLLPLLLIIPFLGKAQSCIDNPTQTDVSRHLSTETTHNPIGDSVEVVYMVQYGVFLQKPEKLPMFVVAYPFQVINNGITTTMWICFWERYFYYRRDAEFTVQSLKKQGVCQPFIKEVLIKK